MSLFFKNPKVGFGLRSKYYSAMYRDSNAHAWLTKKIAYARASAGGSALGTPTAGGIGAAGMYHGKHRLPDPHITSVKISNEGDFGTLRKAQVDFTVYDLGSLQAMSGFFKLSANMSISYGWANAAAAGSNGSFVGVVYNYSYSINTDGSFSCTSYAIGKGVYSLGFSIQGASPGTNSVADPAGITISDHNVFSAITVAVQNAKPAAGTSDGNYAAVELPEAITDPPAPAGEGETAPEKDLTKKKIHYYIRLGQFIDLVNEKIIKKAGNANLAINHGVHDECNQHAASVGSSNPMELLVPFRDNYGDVLNCGIVGASPVSHLDQLYIGVDFIQKLKEDYAKQGGEQDKKKNQTVMHFLNKVFDMIHDRSGGLYKPAISADSTAKWHLVDMNYIPEKFSGLTIPAVTNQSVTRAMSLQSKVPSEMQSAAFVNGASAITGYSSAYISSMTGGNGGSAADTASDGAAAVEECKKAMNEGGLTSENINNMAGAIKKAETPQISQESQIFPIDFSATVDGIEGFEFGDAVSTNQLPAGYAGRVCWTVTKVDHTISGGDWTTTLSTVCRLLR
jgi:hypothetical protein